MIKHRNKYSSKELAMFDALGCEAVNYPISVVQTYRECAIECFIENRQGKAVESLRRTSKALDVGKPHRLTEEFENLIILE